MKSKKKLGIIIYARMNSRRLPNKVLKKIFDKTLLEIVYLRVKKKSFAIPIIVNTSKSKSDDKIVNFCKKNKIKFYRGMLDNVVDRTISCCKKFNLNSFVRICADRPFFDYNLMKKMIRIFLRNNYDIVTNQFPKVCPKGLACEVASLKVFDDLKSKKISKIDEEHIFNYFYKNKKTYKIYNYIDKFYKKRKKINLSIDTKTDLNRTKKIFERNERKILIDTKKIIG
tara:strand:+ start:110 stop:790 length:681 start_codon:yes stop_codon:yes gene_type:complete